ncbi:heme-binding protein [Roseospira marina]|uniref:Heme-binding protein n=1 Tax=Roseospira marina TaxID=140057 RepID=A0A5M6IHF9_9PROT|nr:heme-binding protein [Roseospira marina]KAA5607065.1 heme-binding protein [Roseospira marina]MBB4312744.1 uncharacterized protein GlcG (DUF336 family) [Roseospira marina]MBB5086483.1 uncharacterized protein GlcG (DUF336 family) [Roseospira marina]
MTATTTQADLATLVRGAVDQALARTRLTLAGARRLAEAAEAEGRTMGVPIVVAVVDAAGGLMLLHRMDGALPASTELAANKAFTAVQFRMATHELGALAQPGQPLYGVGASHQGRIVLFGGGYPCRAGETLIGGLGISGGTVDEDMAIATQALRAFSD